MSVCMCVYVQVWGVSMGVCVCIYECLCLGVCGYMHVGPPEMILECRCGGHWDQKARIVQLFDLFVTSL